MLETWSSRKRSLAEARDAETTSEEIFWWVEGWQAAQVEQEVVEAHRNGTDGEVAAEFGGGLPFPIYMGIWGLSCCQVF